MRKEFELMKSLRCFGCLLAAGLVASAPLRGEIVGQFFDTAAPPAVLGGYALIPFAPDPRPIFQYELSVPTPVGGELLFSAPLHHRRVGVGWAGWAQGRYLNGDLYVRNDGQQFGTLTLPAGTRAFAFGLAHALGGTMDFEITAEGGPTLRRTLDGLGTSGQFGFYLSELDDPPLTRIQIRNLSWFDVALGELYIAIPEPATALLLLVGGLTLRLRRS